MMMLFLNWVNTTGEYILGRSVKNAAEVAIAAGSSDNMDLGQFIGSFYAQFFTVVNIVGLILQLFIVSRVLKLLGVRIAICILEDFTSLIELRICVYSSNFHCFGIG